MKKSILTVAIVMVVGVLGFGVYSIIKPDASSESSVQTTTQTNVQAASFSEDGKIVTYQGEEGITALTTLESMTSVNSQDSSYGKFVTGVNGVEADSSSEYWAFYVNGKLSDEGAGTYSAKANDKLEWRLEKL